MPDSLQPGAAVAQRCLISATRQTKARRTSPCCAGRGSLLAHRAAALRSSSSSSSRRSSSSSQLLAAARPAARPVRSRSSWSSWFSPSSGSRSSSPGATQARASPAAPSKPAQPSQSTGAGQGTPATAAKGKAHAICELVFALPHSACTRSDALATTAAQHQLQLSVRPHTGACGSYACLSASSEE